MVLSHNPWTAEAVDPYRPVDSYSLSMATVEERKTRTRYWSRVASHGFVALAASFMVAVTDDWWIIVPPLVLLVLISSKE